jgi:hypothetical protein
MSADYTDLKEQIESLKDALIDRDQLIIYLEMLEEGKVIDEEIRRQLARDHLIKEFPGIGPW